MTELFGFDLSEYQFLLTEGEQLDPALIAASQGIAWLVGELMAAWPAIAAGVIVAGLVMLAARALTRIERLTGPQPEPATLGAEAPARTAHRTRPLAFPARSAHYDARQTAQGRSHGQGRDA